MGHGRGPPGRFSEMFLSNLTKQSHFLPIDTLLKLIPFHKHESHKLTLQIIIIIQFFTNNAKSAILQH